jgi:hypothetical protein
MVAMPAVAGVLPVPGRPRLSVVLHHRHLLLRIVTETYFSLIRSDDVEAR